MKSIFFIMISFLLLVGCGNEVTQQQNNTDHNNIPSVKESENNDEEIIESEEKAVNQELKKEQEFAEKEQEEQKPKYKLNVNNWDIEPIGDANEKVVLLTIDDAPDKYGLEMAKTLHELDAKAIFFVNGHFIDTPEEKAVLKEIYDMGFPIGNHTWNHHNLKKLSKEQQRKEIVSLNDEIEAITGERPKFFRAPFGVNTDYSKEVVKEEKMLLMNWSFGYDWNKEYMSKEAIADIMVNTPLLHSGSNLLMHDREWTNAALEDIVIGLREKGYKMVNPHLIKTP